MSDQVPKQPVFIMDLTVAIRADNEKAAQTEIARRLRALGEDRDSTAEIGYPRKMLPSTPLFSALERDKDGRWPK